MRTPLSHTAEAHHPATGRGVFLRRWKWLVLLAWVLFAVVATPLAEKIGDVERDDAAAFLPSGVESTEVATLIEQAGGDETSTALIVYSSEAGQLPSTALSAIEGQQAHVADALGSGVGITDPQRSEDGVAVIFAVTGLTEQSAEQVTAQLRGIVSPPADGVTVHVTGEAALGVDNDAGDVDAALLFTSMLIVAVLLLLTYRSPVLWLLPLFAAVLAVQVARGAVYLLGDAGVAVTELSSAILIVLVFGAATDHAMLLLNRYREELGRHSDHHDALGVAVRRTAPALIASAGTVVLGLLCLLAASLAGLRGLGPIAASGVVIALAAMLSAFPALLAVVGPRVFWPRIPSPAHPQRAGSHRLWSKLADIVIRRARLLAATVTVVLAGAAFLATGVSVSADPIDKVPPGSESVDGYTIAQQHFRSGLQAPLLVVLPEHTDSAQVSTATEVVSQVPGVDHVSLGESLPGDRPILRVDLAVPAYGDEAATTLDQLRLDVDEAVPGTLVGGTPAVQLDYKDAALDDVLLVAPLLLLVVSLVIGLLLRSILAAVLVLGTVLLSLAASFGVSWVIFEQIRGYGPVAADLFVYILVFLVALGVDYNIFLAARIREERRHRSTTESVRRGLTHTGGVITAAGLVLAGTFFALAQLPDVTVAEVGIAVAVGVLMDALVVRTFLFPALVTLLGDRTWWPGRPAQRRPNEEPSIARILAVVTTRGWNVGELLTQYVPEGGPETADAARIRDLLDRADDPWSRTTPLHVTGSALIVHPSSQRVLLRWHQRQQAWLQVGGHADPGETDPLAIALREGREETGLTDLTPWPDAGLVHVAIVPVPARADEPAHEHADLRFVLATERPDEIVPEHPDAELRWLTVDEARELTAEANLRATLRRVEWLLAASTVGR